MVNINLPEDNNDIYALGFDKSLNRAPDNGGIMVDDSVSQSSYSGVFSDPAQGIGFSAMATGSQSSMAVLDPSKGLWLGATTFAAAPFAVNMNGEMRATSGKFSGDITGATGTFTGTVTIGSLNIPDTTTASSMHVDSNGNTWWGANVASGSANANAAVLNTGAATFKSVTLSTSVAISGIANNTSTDISLLEKTHTMTFTSASATQVNWTSGTVTLSNGRTFSISSGNTGSMAALTYIYVDPGVSSTVLQTTTTAATALGANKILIGSAQNNTVTASYIPYGPGQPLVDGANIGALSIVAGNIAATTITAAKMNVSQLSAISVDAGALTAGSISVVNGGNTVGLTPAGTNAIFSGTTGSPQFKVTPAGAVTATSGTIGGWTLGANALTAGSGATTVGMDNSVTAGDDVRFYAGSATPSSAPFRVTEAGNLTATSATITGVLTASSGSSLFDYQTYTANSTWTKPAAAGSNSEVFVMAWGGGGAGGGMNAFSGAGGGGGGGAYIQFAFRASDLTGTVAITVASTATGGTGSGTAGGNSSFGSYLTAYGGGGGVGQISAGGNGGGGGIAGAGNSGSGASGGAGGIYLGGAAGAPGGDSSFGGGGGATTANPGGNSIYGGGGGGNPSGTPNTSSSVYGGGGGAYASGGATSAGSNISIFAGNGGFPVGNGLDGLPGTAPAGGGSGANTTGSAATKNGGNGARGEIRVWTKY